MRIQRAQYELEAHTAVRGGTRSGSGRDKTSSKMSMSSARTSGDFSSLMLMGGLGAVDRGRAGDLKKMAEIVRGIGNTGKKVDTRSQVLSELL